MVRSRRRIGPSRAPLVVVVVAVLVLALVGLVTAALAAEVGIASWYGPGFHGRTTASGEIYDQNGRTCAHKTLKFGTRVRVTDLRTGRSTICRVNDRGPFVRGRVIDLSRWAARRLGIMRRGTSRVRVDVVGR